MSYSVSQVLGTAAPAPCLPLATLVASHFTAPGPRYLVLHLDGSARPGQYGLGVCHQVSQLLLLHRAGVEVWLHRVNPLLARCLRLLRVAHLFRWVA